MKNIYLIILTAISLFLVSNIYAEKYIDYKGEELTQETYDMYISECYKLKSDKDKLINFTLLNLQVLR